MLRPLTLSALCVVGIDAAALISSFARDLSAVPPIYQVSTQQWAALNKTVGGRLAKGRPIAAPCYATYNGSINTQVDLNACQSIQQNRKDSTFLASQIGGFEEGEWAACQATGASCPLDYNLPVDPVNPLVGNCQQGQVAPYYINVASVSDVQAGLQFAQQHNLPLVIKNTGHDYKGRSAAPNSLALWTHNYQPAMTLTNHFTPDGCSASSGKTVTFGAGQGFDGIYKFADQHNVTVVGGSSQTVGAAGGWITGGGHSALSPTLGLGVDNVQQLRAVLPNGTYVTANRCQNQDLFFALRGGGGGTFGVVMEMTTQAHPQLTLQAAEFEFATTTPNATMELISILVANANKWACEGWGGYLFPAAESPLLSLVVLMTPHLTTAEATKSMQPLSDFGKQFGNVNVTGSVQQYNSFYDVYEAFIANGLENMNGGGVALASRLVPAANFEGAKNQADLTTQLSNIALAKSTTGGFETLPLFVCVTPPNSNFVTNDGTSSVTPAWYDSTWHVIGTTTFANEATASDSAKAFQAIHDRFSGLRALTPGSGAYQNEADVYEDDPVGAYWGRPNYDKLLTIKKTLDPGNVLSVRDGVGSQQSDSRFSCYPDL